MINKLVMVDIPGLSLGADTRAHLLRYQPGGVILFRKNIDSFEQTRALVLELRAVLGDDVLLAIDAEGGGVWRASFLPHAPSAMSLGAANDEALAQDVGAMVARGLRALGINWDFAPVLDVNNNSQNPVISDRSFGEDPARVAALGAAWARGLMMEGVASCLKHFPGHGDTAVDSHHGLPTVDKPLSALSALEFAPFHQLLPLAPSVMTAHIVYPALDSLPATLSHRILTGLLREQWGYQGVIVTDSMGMAAIDANWGRGEAAILSVLAGADMLEGLGSVESQVKTFLALETAEREGRIPRQRIAASLERLMALSQGFPAIETDYGPAQLEADRALATDAWGRGIVRVGEPQLPAPGSSVTLIAAAEIPGEFVSELGVSGAALVAALEQVYQVTPLLYQVQQPLEALGAVREARARGDTVIFASTSRRRLSEDTKTLALEACPALHLALWNPYAVQDVPAPALVSFGYRPEAIAALLEVLRGTRSAVARAPARLEA